MLLEYKPESGKISAAVASDGDVELYDCTLSFCDSPTCPCAIANISLTPVNRHFEPISTGNPVKTISVDVVKRCLKNENKHKSPSDRITFEHNFVSQLDDEDFDMLYEQVVAHKKTIAESAPEDAIDFDFDYERIESEGSMCAYNSVLPYGKSLRFSIDGRNFLVMDSHCLAPKCRCTQTAIEIFPVPEKGMASEPICDCFVDYKKRTWQPIKTQTPSLGSTENIKAAIESQISDFYQHLLTRQARLKAIYRHQRNKNYIVMPVCSSEKTGRNDPCPCGSGKKYKKCCMKTQ